MLNLTQSLTSFLKLIRDNMIVFTIILYGLAYIFNVSYYALFFNIPVFYYISLNDLTFWGIQYLVKFILVGIGFIFLAYALTFIFVSILVILRLILIKKTFFKLTLHNFKSRQTPINFYRAFNFFNKATRNKTFEGFHGMIGAMLLLLSFVSSFPLQIKYFFLLDLLLYFTISDGFSLKQSATFKSLKTYILVVIGIFFGSQFTGYLSAINVKKGETSTNISFIDNGVSYCASGKKFRYSYIGETSNYIFLYDRQNENSMVFNKEKISNLTIGESKEIKKTKEVNESKKSTIPILNNIISKDSIDSLIKQK